MTKINIHAAKTQLSKLIEQVEQGEQFIIARGGKPVALSGPLPTRQVRRRPGLLKNHIQIADDFDAPLPSRVLSQFYAGTLEPRRK